MIGVACEKRNQFFIRMGISLAMIYILFYF